MTSQRLPEIHEWLALATVVYQALVRHQLRHTFSMTLTLFLQPGQRPGPHRAIGKKEHDFTTY